ncbi:hypothetical protein TanjilG_29366 [Lupinus angustifolius]|uniref:Uncharacterized protein n=1 Tax=Lupinus angustifolius TaxID=3871 RepID=A0A1J7GEY9_LUPAN|nr:PREDICTED: proline-rich extensin-like protein EPR1 [Lupinus angustifolius]OIV98963.1 hypothetical protein TanjilG_29366 [Lupinus angustifolius]
MGKVSMQQCTLVHFFVPLLLVVSFCYASSALATTQVSGNEVNTDVKLINEEVAKTNPEVHNEEAKFKGFFHHKPIFKKPFFKKPIPTYKPIPKPYPIIKPIPVPVYKPIPKPIPVVKPIPIPVYKPIPKPVPIYKPIPVFKKPFHKSFPISNKNKPLFPPQKP